MPARRRSGSLSTSRRIDAGSEAADARCERRYAGRRLTRSAMPVRSIFLALLALFPIVSLAEVAVPDTPAGHALAAFLEAVNSGDRAQQESFVKEWPSRMSVEDVAEWKSASGGYDLLEFRSSDPTNVYFRIRQRSRDVEEAGRLQVSAESPMSLKMVNAWRMPPGATWE